MALLGDLADIIRSKNSGPFELTLDVICANPEQYARIRNSGVLTRERIAALYGIPAEQVLVAAFFDQARAFKATIVRPTRSGAPHETDTYGGQQGAPLYSIEIP